MTIDVRIEEVTAQHALMLRVKSSYANISEAMTQAVGELITHIGNENVSEGDISGPLFALYHSTEDPEAWEYSVGFPVSRPIREEGNITMGALPGGKVAVSRHMGDYSGLKDQWNVFAQWIESEGHKSTHSGDDCWESYVISPPVETEPANFVTELYWPID